MSFFKKALVASAIVGACGVANAADVTDGTVKYSAQGAEIAASAAATSLRVIVREQLEAGDKITLVFGKGIKNALTAANFGGLSTGTGNVGIVYGSGTYTMGNPTFSTVSGVTTMTMEVLTGDPVTKDSSFEINLDGADLDLTKASETTVTYSAVSGLTGDAKDTTGDNTGQFVVTADQYGAAVKTKFNGVIERESQVTYTSGFVTANTDADSVVLTIADNQNLATPANGANVEATVVVMGDFSNASLTGTATGSTETPSAVAIDNAKGTATFTIADSAADGIAGEYTLVLDHGAAVIKPSELTVTVTFDADDTDATNTVQLAADKADAGEWEIDATIINVPYFPVGFEGTSTSVHFSNRHSSAVDVIVSAVTLEADGTHVTHDPVDLGVDLAAESVTKVGQQMLMDLFGITAGTKMSVTFNVDGDADKVNAYAFTSSEVGRTEISDSQSNGIK